ncbi:Rab family GTPase [Candidatus Hodarchaeum mangrovi]
MPNEVIIKLNSVGSFYVGKTSLIRRYTENTFSEDYLPTLGVDITVKRGIIINGSTLPVRLVLMDTAGEERFGSLRKTYFEGSLGCIAVYDISKSDTFGDLDYWIDEYRKIAGDKAVITIIGNKIDLADRRKVTEEEGKKYARSQGTSFYECSAKWGSKIIPKVFIELVRNCLGQLN